MADDIKILQAPDVKILQQVLNKALEGNRNGGVTVWVVSIGQVIVSNDGGNGHTTTPKQLEASVEATELPLIVTASEPGNGSLAVDFLPDQSATETLPVVIPQVRKRGKKVECTREQILAALKQCQWHRAMAAAMLGMNRNTLSSYMYKLKLKRPGPENIMELPHGQSFDHNSST